MNDWNGLGSGNYTYTVYNGPDTLYNGAFSIYTADDFSIPSGYIEITEETNFDGDGSINITDIYTTNNLTLSDFDFQWSNGMSGANITDLSSGNYNVIVTDPNGCFNTYTYSVGTVYSGVVFGCTDSTACNYDPSADIDNNSCLPVPNCNADICTGDVEVADSCACITSIIQVVGCMDSTANNFDASANCDDGSCYITALLAHHDFTINVYPNPTFGILKIETDFLYFNFAGTEVPV